MTDENLHDSLLKTKYRPWMRKLVLITGLFFTILAIALFILIYLRATNLQLLYIPIAPLIIGIVSIFISKKGSDKLIAYMFGGY